MVKPRSTPNFRIGVQLRDEAAGEQRAHDRIDVDGADRGHLAARDRLFVSDHGEGLQRCLRQPRRRLPADELRDEVVVILADVEPPPTADFAQLEAPPGPAAATVVVLPQGLDRLPHRGDRGADRRRECDEAERLLNDQENGLQLLGER